ncbi:hypothetical protein F2Q68_00026903 [Brassica cretica]|uniref:DUF1985 domain-containing protein n=1 Tax=Brassica cretica TaxID=69181 RepID=A0A8S9IDQ2_BRACR|nr:hypothetical protein F2Q68_00026903 [Brassica cretica]
MTIRFLFSDLKPHLVELCRGSVTAGVVGDHIFSDYDCCSVILKDNSDDFEEVFYEVLHSGRLPGSLLSLPDDLRLHRRLPQNIPECRKMDLPELLLRIHTLGEEPPAGKSISYHTDDLKLFDALRQALHAGEYEELKESKLGVEKVLNATRASLARLVMDLGNFENYPWGRVTFKTSMINFVQKDFGEMFPRWDFDAEDSAAENIIKVMFNAKPRWKWTMDCWEVTGTKPSVKKEVTAAETESVVKEESGRPRKKARKEKSVEARAKASKWPPTERDIADAMRDGFGMCLKEIKLLGGRMEAVEKKVGITKKGTASNDLQIIASSPPKRGHEPGGEARRQTKNAKAMEYVHGKRLAKGYDPFAPIDKKMSTVLTDWVKLDPTSSHALGMSFPPEFYNKNAKAIREKMALDIFKETPGCHSKENKDNDENMGT